MLVLEDENTYINTHPEYTSICLTTLTLGQMLLVVAFLILQYKYSWWL